MITILNYLREHHFALGIVAFIFWSSLYLTISAFIQNVHAIKLLPKLSQVNISEASVSAVQGFVCGGIGILAVLNCKHDVLQAEYELLVHYCTFGTGYFMYDLIAMYYATWLDLKAKGKHGKFVFNFKYYIFNNGLMIAHHIILTAVLFPALITYSTMGHFFAGCFFCMELSSPFVNFRIILSRTGLKASKLYLYNGILMMVLFAIFRVLVFAYMYLHYAFQQSYVQHISVMEALWKIPNNCHFYCFIIVIPQVYWLSMMVHGVFSVLANRPKALDKYD